MSDTIVRRHYMLTMRLDISSVDVAQMKALRLLLQHTSIGVSTLHAEQSINSDAVRRAYLCHNECRKQQPPVELRQEPIALDRWLSSIVIGPDAAPELYFLAIHEQEYIGVCMLERSPQKPDTLTCGFTGVLPAWTGRGIASALKAHSLLCAVQRGVRYVETNNLVINRGMCAINRSLGFQPVSKRLICYPIPPTEASH